MEEEEEMVNLFVILVHEEQYVCKDGCEEREKEKENEKGSGTACE